MIPNTPIPTDAYQRAYDKAYAAEKAWQQRPDLSSRIAEAIKRDVTGRRGWRQEWSQFDEDIQEEIIQTWIKLIQKELAAS